MCWQKHSYGNIDGFIFIPCVTCLGHSYQSELTFVAVTIYMVPQRTIGTWPKNKFEHTFGVWLVQTANFRKPEVLFKGTCPAGVTCVEF